jgi:hypothetical protein
MARRSCVGRQTSQQPSHSELGHQEACYRVTCVRRMSSQPVRALRIAQRHCLHCQKGDSFPSSSIGSLHHHLDQWRELGIDYLTRDLEKKCSSLAYGRSDHCWLALLAPCLYSARWIRLSQGLQPSPCVQKTCLDAGDAGDAGRCVWDV